MELQGGYFRLFFGYVGPLGAHQTTLSYSLDKGTLKASRGVPLALLPLTGAPGLLSGSFLTEHSFLIQLICNLLISNSVRDAAAAVRTYVRTYVIKYI